MGFYVFGSGTLICTPFGANAAGNPTPLQLATMQEVSIDISASQKELYGKLQFPVAIARTAGKLNMKAKFANVYSKVLNDLFFGNTVLAGAPLVILDEVGTPASNTITVTQSALFLEDLGVRDAVTGNQLTLHASPAVGQYSHVAGVYTFNASDTTGKLTSYRYTPASGGFSTTVANKPMGAMPVFSAVLANNQYGNNFIIRFPNCISAKLTINMKNEDFMVPEFDFSAFSDGAGNLFEWDTDQ